MTLHSSPFKATAAWALEIIFLTESFLHYHHEVIESCCSNYNYYTFDTLDQARLVAVESLFEEDSKREVVGTGNRCN